MPQMGNRQTPLRMTLAWNTSAQLVARGVSALGSFVITLLLARRFGVNGFGDFVKITTYIAFFYLLVDFGINAIYLQRTQNNADGRDTHWEELLSLRLVMGSVLVLLASALLWILPQGTAQGYTGIVRIGILLYAPSIIFQAIITTTNALFQKHLRYDLSAIGVTAGTIVSVILISIVAVSRFGGITIIPSITALLIGTAANAGVALYLTRKLQKIVHSAISREGVRQLFIASLPLGITLLFNLVYFRVDSIILTLTRTTAEVGIYGLAYKIFELPLVVPTFFMNALYPVLLNRTQEYFNDLLKKSALLLFGASIVVTGVLWVGAPVISLIRTDFVSGIGALRVLSLGLPFFFLSSLTMWTLIAKKQQLLLAKIYGISMVVNLSLNLFFTPRYGYMSAAWITVFSEGFVLLLSGFSAIRLISSHK